MGAKYEEMEGLLETALAENDDLKLKIDTLSSENKRFVSVLFYH